MADPKLDDMVQRALHLGILTLSQLQEMWASFGTQSIDSETFLQETVRRGFLTNYQVERLVSGESTGFYFGDYKILYHVGAGTFARVYRAVHKNTGKIVAVKVLRARFNDDQTVINHFVHEAELGIGLRHPNIVPIHEVKSEPYQHFMVMDFIEGQTLREFLRIRKKVEPKLATRIIMDVCSGLDYAAKRGLQHRDMKLSNVLLSSLQKAMLVDFGLATIAENVELGNAEVRNQRSIDYAALERITGVKRDDRRSDIYFLGCIYYHLLTGVPPLFETRERSKRLDKNRFLNVRPIQNVDPLIPRAVTLVVNKAMSLDVAKRYQTTGEFYADIEICARRLADGTANDGISPMQIETGLAKIAPSIPKEKQKAVMIADSDTKLQEVFRESLKKAGFRVLVATSAERAVDRLLDDHTVADIVVFNGQSLGQSGVEAFNRLAGDPYSADLPSIIMLDDKQTEMISQLNKADHRIALTMPITMKVLKEKIADLIGSDVPPSGVFTPVPLVEIPVDVLSTLVPSSESEESEERDSDYETEESAVENSSLATQESVGYKDVLAEHENESDQVADALFDANVPKLIERPEEKKREPESEVSQPEPESVIPEPQVPAPDSLTLEELQEAASKARLKFGEAIRAEEEVNKRLREFIERKTQLEEAARQAKTVLQETQTAAETALSMLAEATFAVDSVALIEAEAIQLVGESTRSRKDAEATLSIAREKAREAASEMQRLAETYEQTQERVASALTTGERTEEIQAKMEELQANFSKVNELLQQVRAASESSFNAASEARGIADSTAEKINELTLEQGRAQEEIQSVTTESEVAVSVAEETRQTSEKLAQEAEEAIQAAADKEDLATVLEEEARKAIERAEQARKEATEAANLAEEAILKAEHAVEEAKIAANFVQESTQKRETLASKIEELRDLLQTFREEHDRLKQEADLKEGAAVQAALEQEQAEAEWETAKKALEEAQEEHTRLLAEKDRLPELQSTVLQLASDKEKADEAARLAAEEVERETSRWEEAEKHAEECRIRLEKVREEAMQLKAESDTASQAAEQAQRALDAALENQRKAEAELRNVREEETELNRLAQERAAAKEAARKAADAAQKALVDFTETAEVPLDSVESEQSGSGSGRHALPGSVSDRVAAAIRARVEAALAERKKKEER
ncbi:MAG: protein kinase [Planctomycetaceae bacterium]|nr:protein kinase [Planctomycetaceae bacterium]